MNRRVVAASLLVLGTGLATPSAAFRGDDSFAGSPPDGAYPPSYGTYPPQGAYPPSLGTYPPPGAYPPPYGTYPPRHDAYPPPHAARPPAPYSMPHASGPDSADSVAAARRLYTVADTVALRGASLCEARLKPHTGMRAWSLGNAGPQAPHSAGRPGAGPGVTVFSIAREGPAERAGLRQGDRITSINGESIPAMAGAMSVYAARIEAALARRGPILVGYSRDGRKGVARIVPAPACGYRVVFSDAPMINALTDGHSVTVMRGLVNLLARDDELALVVGHEIGHNVLGHFARGRALGHQAGPFNSGAQASMRQFEREADYIGLYFVALAGYDIETAIQSSHRMGAVGPMGDRGSATHPSQAERRVLLAATAREIRAKLGQGAPLKPNLLTGRDASRLPDTMVQ